MGGRYVPEYGLRMDVDLYLPRDVLDLRILEPGNRGQTEGFLTFV